MVKKLFVAATGQHVGKTTVSLGLIRVLKKKGYKVGFIKPIGQRYVSVKGENIDEDAVLIKSACKLGNKLKVMSPVAVEKGYTEKYVRSPRRNIIEKKIFNSFNEVAKGKDIVVIEGTGHGGVGSIIDFSNADMAKMLGAEVVIVSGGGIGKPYDEIALNQRLYESKGVNVLGVVSNKVLDKKKDKVKEILSIALKRHGLDLFGCVPYRVMLSSPSIGQVSEMLNAKILNRGHGLERSVEKIVVGGMGAHNALTHFDKNSVLLVSGDRDGLLLAAICEYFSMKKRKRFAKDSLSGIIINGGIMPQPEILRLVKNAGIPVLMTDLNMYDVAYKVHDFIVKIFPNDVAKIKKIENLIDSNVKVASIIRKL